MPASSLASTPPEMVDNICSYLDKSSLSQTRLVNHYISLFATSWLFREVKFDTRGTNKDLLAFTEIAQSAKLSRLVRKVDCTAFVTWNLSFFPYLDDRFRESVRQLDTEDASFIAGAVCVLPFITCFGNLSNLRVSFAFDPIHDAWPTLYTRSYFSDMDIESGIIQIILQCLAGTWSFQRQNAMSEILRQETGDSYPCRRILGPTSESTTLKSLELRDMNAELDSRVANSAEFKTIMGRGGVVDFGLCAKNVAIIGTQGPLGADPRDEMDKFERLPKVWFIPDVAENLRALSLAFGYNWGWHPKVDLETISPTFPNLRELRLSDFIFSHERQAEWVASLGKNTRSGGLERLVLHKCRALYVAIHCAPLDFNENGVGYPNKENINSWWNPDWEEICSYFPIRWYTVFEGWQNSMPALISFQLDNFTDEDDTIDRYEEDLSGWDIYDGDDDFLDQWDAENADAYGPAPRKRLTEPKQDEGILNYTRFAQRGGQRYHAVPKNHVGLPYDEAAFSEHVAQLIQNSQEPVGPCVARDEEAAAQFLSLVKSRKQSAMARLI
ncbi:hypothetical protein B0J13DRAFT_643236 [Dactylonectria estremocensis]|uniref:F-box domain-containing protein n=1 Tax=Dactylonectria estremocensis TaxID=1079267 RepID=A0A9P9JI36_9HYPO|nr:hypothetical protein B0J13DRAFT_643236 [Dactylonectria estremocensis]